MHTKWRILSIAAGIMHNKQACVKNKHVTGQLISYKRLIFVHDLIRHAAPPNPNSKARQLGHWITAKRERTVEILWKEFLYKELQVQRQGELCR